MTNKFNLLIFIFISFNSIGAQVEPNAGSWKTWFITSVIEYRVPPSNSRKKEIKEVIAIQKNITTKTLQQIQYWNAGPPSYRWQNMIEDIWMSDAMNNGILALMLVSVANYDATIAAWDSKYAYKQSRPFELDKRIKVYGSKPDNPSYPCEYSVSAGVASTIIAHFFPQFADSVKHMAEDVMHTRIAGGFAFPSDTRAGYDLGKKIALQEIEKTKGFLNNTPWDGKRPQGEGLWNGAFALFANAGKSKTVAIVSGNQFRPGPPPDFSKDMLELKNYKNTAGSMAKAFFYDGQHFWSDVLTKKIFEYNLNLNPPKAAQIYATVAIGTYDGFVACFDAKYAYWGIRPEQYDTTFKPVLFESPPFPGYPSGHAAVSSVTAEIYAHFFPADKTYFLSKAKEVAESRFQGGIHFRTDNEVALDLGKKVAKEILSKLEKE